MAIKGLTVSSGKVYQDVDLSEIAGVSLEGHEALKLAICQEVIDYMRDRTLGGRDYNGATFAKYSESYKDSDAFEAYGKSNRVDMQLTGDMLASIDFETVGSRARFLFDDEGDEANAFGHMSGMEGHKHLDGKVPKRLFFGITEDELNGKILPKFKEDLDAIKASSSEDAENEYLRLEDALGLSGNSAGSGITLEELLGGLD